MALVNQEGNPSEQTERHAAPPGDARPLNAPTDADGFQHAGSDPELVRLWLVGKSDNTRRAYERDLKEFIDYVDKPIRQITLGDAQNFRRYLEDERDLAICRLFYGSALRRSELASLAWRDLTFRSDLPGEDERGQVTVFGKGEKERTVLLSASTWTVLTQLRQQERADGRGGGENPLFWSREGGALTGTQVYNVVRRAARNAGIEKPVSPHSFRHAHLSHALDRGATIEEARETAGHSSIQTTSVYVHARISTGRQNPDSQRDALEDAGEADRRNAGRKPLDALPVRLARRKAAQMSLPQSGGCIRHCGHNHLAKAKERAASLLLPYLSE